MGQYRRLFFLIVASVALTACGLRYIDAPPVTQEDRWIKEGYNKNAIWRALNVCGYDRSTWNMKQQIKVDECMLSQKFIFIDSPYGEQGSICKFPDSKELPSCRYLEDIRQKKLQY